MQALQVECGLLADRHVWESGQQLYTGRRGRAPASMDNGMRVCLCSKRAAICLEQAKLRSDDKSIYQGSVKSTTNWSCIAGLSL